jgi:hypothetical protein
VLFGIGDLETNDHPVKKLILTIDLVCFAEIVPGVEYQLILTRNESSDYLLLLVKTDIDGLS